MYIKCLYKQLSGQWTIQYHYHRISTILSISWTEGYSEYSPNNGHELKVALCQKILEKLAIANTNIPNHFPEQKV